MKTTGGRSRDDCCWRSSPRAARCVGNSRQRHLCRDGSGLGAGSAIGISFAAHRPGVVAGYLPLVVAALAEHRDDGVADSSSQVPIASYVMVGLSPLILASPLPGA